MKRYIFIFILFCGFGFSLANNKAESFVKRLYENILQREPDLSGLQFWTKELKNGKSALYVAKKFFLSKEFKNKNLTNEEYIDLCYKTLLNRDPDEKGLSFWLNQLKEGKSRKFVLSNFLKSDEFENLKNEYLSDKNNSNSGNSTSNNLINSNDYRLLAWNDLGMHCMDDDFSVFSILPPYNNLVAQLIKREYNGAQRVISGVEITYESAFSLDGFLNTTSIGKTDFWDYVTKLFNTILKSDIGLKGNPTPSKKPAKMKYDRKNDWWIAEGIPITPFDDNGKVNHYPLVKVTAKDMKGNILAQTLTVLPVSIEMDCKKCHSSSSNYIDARPIKGWVNDKNSLKDYKYNILRLHDQKHNISAYLKDLKTRGYVYKNSLEETARSGTPILCAVCHKSNALGTKGFLDIPPLTEAIHSRHAYVIDPYNGLELNSLENRSACYACHPGSLTKCLRGAMGKAKDTNGNNLIECQSCHGMMSAVGKRGREGWFDEPSCQNCHQGSKRYTKAVTDKFKGTLRAFLDNRFATNTDVPFKGKSLYKFSKGHGKLACSACHGSTHAIYESSQKEDNLQSINAQGHAGTIAECIVCHKSTPRTVNGGPHGLHTVGEEWVKMHGDVVEENGAFLCKACHGNDFGGSFLSKTFAKRVFKVEHINKTFEKGHQVSCYDCHNGPNGGEDD